jgi:translation elongation factor EF-Ts
MATRDRLHAVMELREKMGCFLTEALEAYDNCGGDFEAAKLLLKNTPSQHAKGCPLSYREIKPGAACNCERDDSVITFRL